MTKPTYRYFGVLRLFLAVLVMLNHAWFLSPNSFIATWSFTIHIGSASVLAFFVLSGLILSEAADKLYAGRPLAFLTNRALKILPGYAGALILSITVHAWLWQAGLLHKGIAFEGYPAIPDAMFDPVNLARNVFAVFPEFMYFDAFRPTDSLYLFVRYIWAVRVEVVFYLFLGVMLGWQPRLSQRAISLLALAFAGLYMTAAWRGTLVRGTLDAVMIYAPAFLLGISLYWIGRGWGTRLLFVVSLALCLVPAAEIITGVNIARDTALVPYVGWLGIGAFYIMVVLIVAFGSVSMPEGLAKTIDKRLGDLSYALYLNHYAVVILVAALLPAGSVGNLEYWGAVVLALVVAYLMNKCVERPFLGWRRKVRGQAI